MNGSNVFLSKIVHLNSSLAGPNVIENWVIMISKSNE